MIKVMKGKKTKLCGEEWKQIEKKYGKLMYAVCHRIGGDKITSSIEDSYQDLCITAMDAVKAYSKKVGKEFSEFFQTKNFDKYIKTCFWNKKNNTGSKIKKKYKIRNCMSLSGNIEPLESYSELQCSDVLLPHKDISLEPECRKVYNLICRDRRLIKPDGKVNISKLSAELGKSKTKVRFILDKLRTYFKDYDYE